MTVSVKELVDKHGFSKYRIAKLVGVSWNTVSFWYKGIFSPNKEHLAALQRIENDKQGKAGKD